MASVNAVKTERPAVGGGSVLKVTLSTGPGATRPPPTGATPMGGADAGLSEKERAEVEKGYLEGFTYRPITAEKKILIQHHTTTSTAGDTVVATLSYDMGTERELSVHPKEVEATLKNVSQLEKDRIAQKKTLQECNAKLGNYIDKSRLLESHNRSLAEELRALRENWGKETQRIRRLYDVELGDLRRKLEEAENQKGILEVKLELVEGEVARKRDQAEEEIKKRNASKDDADRTAKKQAQLEAELELLRKKFQFLENEKEKLRKESDKLREEIKKARGDLENESINHVRAENNAHCLKEELDFLRLVWEQEKRELEKLAKRDPAAESKEFWKAEISQLFRDLHEQFEPQLADYRTEVTAQFQSKVDMYEKAHGKESDKATQLRNDVARLRNENDQLKDRLAKLEPHYASLENKVTELQRELDAIRTEFDRQLAALTAELQAAKIEIERLLEEMRRLFDQKIALELEITQYKKLLSMEDSRKTDTNEEVVKAQKVASVQAEKLKHVRGEMTAKTRVDKRSKGNVEISEITLDSRSLTLSNSGTKDEQIGGWKLLRNVDDGRLVLDFVIPANTVLPQGKHIKIWAKNFKPKEAQAVDLELDKPSWGLGIGTVTTLQDTNGEEKAIYTTATVYESH